MNFNEKLLQMRKEAKLSQEELADKLDVTRQSVSKWESGQTYPEMDKLLAICKIFDCSLEELTNDDIKLNDFSREGKNNTKSIIDSALNFINQTYNYLSHITFKEIVKLFITMLILLIIVKILKTPFLGLEKLFIDIFSIIKSSFIQKYLISMFNFVIEGIYLLLSVFIFIYIFKIGFLDKDIPLKEEPTEEEKESDNTIKKEITPNYKYSNTVNKFLNAIGSIIMFFVKLILLFIVIPFIFIIVFLSFGLAIDISLMFQGIFLIGVFLGLIFSIMLVSLIIEFIFDIILNKKHNAKRMIITLLIGLIGGGISTGILAMEISNYEILDATPTDSVLKVDKYNFTYKKGMYIDSYYGYTEHPDETMKDNEILIEVSNYEYSDYLYIVEDKNNNTLIVNRNRADGIKLNNYSNIIIKALKEKKIYTYYIDHESRFVVYANKATLNKLSTNWEKEQSIRIQEEWNDEKQKIITQNSELKEEINSLKEEISSLKENNKELEDKVNEYKDKIKSIAE